ncbi:hypothetical protein FRC19_008885 [Serendipita sp. 401]|nr:hypothetical protein FRC19_008885 [Serendipita sp. 401]
MDSVLDVIYKGHWWQHSGLRKLNFYIALVIAASAINGYDSSVLNGPSRPFRHALVGLTARHCLLTGLQILPEFKKHFNSPDGSTLGFMSAAQNFGGLVVRITSIPPYSLSFSLLAPCSSCSSSFVN